ncbi:hypothetical protein HK405_013422 [Cladochytrium tenue]|nr:hypothetical protein HK405_013422 [Cladochytrium tenue]
MHVPFSGFDLTNSPLDNRSSNYFSDRQTDEIIASLQPARPPPQRRQPSIADTIGFASAAQRQQQLQAPQRSALTPSPSPTTPVPIDPSSAAGVAHGFSGYLRDPGGGQPVPAATAVAAAPPPKSVSFERRGGEASAGSASDSAGGSVDGREFFKRARATLSYDEFTSLLSNVKSYNAKEQSRQRTLDNLQQLLGERHRNLFDQFERLLAR